MSSEVSTSSGTTKKIAAAALAVALAAVLMIGGTISYLQSSSSKVVNEFDANNVGVELEETTDDYEIIPGTTQDKDPTVYVDATIDSFVFLVVTDATDGLVDYEIDTSVWTLLSSDTDEDGVTTYVYYHLLNVSGETVDSTSGSYKYGVLVDDQVSYSSSITNEDMYDTETSTDEDGNTTTTTTPKSGITLTFQAYAIQAEPFYSNSYDENSEEYDVDAAAANAWLAAYYGITSDVTGNIEEVSDDDELEEALEDEDVGYVILTSDISLSSTLEIDSEVTIDLAGSNLKNSSDTAITVTSDGSLTITDSSSDGDGTISGTLTSNSGTYQGGAITVNGGDLVVEGGTITGNAESSDSYCAGAIMVYDGTFTFTGGTIENSTAYGYAGVGGVYLYNSTMTMGDDATISSCGNTNEYASTSSYVAGAVRVTYGSTFNMTGGTIENCYISNDSSKVYGTGGVFVESQSTFNMSGGTIEDCTGSCGGAVIVHNSGSTFDLSGGSITKNTATYSGGAVYMYDSAAMTMSGGSITSNTCSSGKGGGIRACSGTTVTITGGTISGNTASAGNNAYIDSGCTLTDDDSILTDYYDGDTAS